MPFAIGSDGPLNPFLNIMFAAMNAANPSQALTVEQAVAAYTRGSAAAELAERAEGDDRAGDARGRGAPVAGHLQGPRSRPAAHHQRAHHRQRPHRPRGSKR